MKFNTNHLNLDYPVFFVGTQPTTRQVGCSEVLKIYWDTYCPWVNVVEIKIKGWRITVDASQLSNLR
jgi:hypothetical protein